MGFHTVFEREKKLEKIYNLSETHVSSCFRMRTNSREHQCTESSNSDRVTGCSASTGVSAFYGPRAFHAALMCVLGATWGSLYKDPEIPGMYYVIIISSDDLRYY